MDLDRFRHGMTTKWVAFCLTDAGLAQGLLLASSQYFANLHYSTGDHEEGNKYQQRALYYRGQLLRAMSDSIPQDARDVTDKIIAKGMFLAFNEVGLAPQILHKVIRGITANASHTVSVGQRYRSDTTHEGL